MATCAGCESLNLWNGLKPLLSADSRMNPCGDPSNYVPWPIPRPRICWYASRAPAATFPRPWWHPEPWKRTSRCGRTLCRQACAGVVDSWPVSIPLLEDGSMRALMIVLVAGIAGGSDGQERISTEPSQHFMGNGYWEGTWEQVEWWNRSVDVTSSPARLKHG